MTGLAITPFGGRCASSSNAVTPEGQPPTRRFLSRVSTLTLIGLTVLLPVKAAFAWEDPTHATPREHAAFCNEQRRVCIWSRSPMDHERYHCTIAHRQCLTRY